MLTLAWYFWPVIWATIGGAALVTAALCVMLALVPAPHPRWRGTTAAGWRHGFRPIGHAHA
jgi:hypothetical protein